MKKIKYLLFVIFAIFMLVACGEKKEEAKTTLDFMLLRKKAILQKKGLI